MDDEVARGSTAWSNFIAPRRRMGEGHVSVVAASKVTRLFPLTPFTPLWLAPEVSVTSEAASFAFRRSFKFAALTIADGAAKDDFATNARLMCNAHAATACVMAMEAWAKFAKSEQKLDWSTAYSLRMR